MGKFKEAKLLQERLLAEERANLESAARALVSALCALPRRLALVAAAVLDLLPAARPAALPLFAACCRSSVRRRHSRPSLLTVSLGGPVAGGGEEGLEEAEAGDEERGERRAAGNE